MSENQEDLTREECAKIKRKEAQQRYREKNRELLRLKSQQYRTSQIEKSTISC
jgi:hypothetical protein